MFFLVDSWSQSDRGSAPFHQVLIYVMQRWLQPLNHSIKQVIKISNNLPFQMMSPFNSPAKNFFMPSSEILLLNADEKTFKSDCELL